MKKIVIVTLLITSLCLCGDTVKKELNQIKGRIIWLQLEKQMLKDLQTKLEQIEDGKLNDVNSEKVKNIVQDYTTLRTNKEIKNVKRLGRKLRKIKD